jgi:hypothetical protein
VHHDKQENNLTSPNSIAKEAEAEAHVADKRHKGKARSAVSLFLILAILLGVALFILLLMLIVIIVFKHRFKVRPSRITAFTVNRGLPPTGHDHFEQRVILKLLGPSFQYESVNIQTIV